MVTLASVFLIVLGCLFPSMVHISSVDATWYYLPGIEPVSYHANDTVHIKVNSLASTETMIPVRYYDVPFCRPPRDIIQSGTHVESLGELLSGDAIYGSHYSALMLKNSSCVPITCEANEELDHEKIARFDELIEDGYRVQMVLDNLPVYTSTAPKFIHHCLDGKHVQSDNRQQVGFALGVKKECAGETLLYNHVEFTIEYHQPAINPSRHKEPTYRIVGFTAVPYSIAHTADSCNADFDVMNFQTKPFVLHTNSTKDTPSSNVVWSYSVRWVENKKVTWATRWDAYLSTSPANTNISIHWLGLVNPLILTVALALSAGLILIRTLRRDLVRYNSTDNIEEIQEEMGWKVVHGDVFRAPRRLSLLAVVLGTGTQLSLMCGTTLFFALLGFLSPANRGALLSSLIFLFCLQGFPAGFVASTVLRHFGEKSWKVIFTTALAFPGILLSLYFFTEVMLAYNHAANVLPFAGFFFLLTLWLGISVPLTVLGASVGFRREPHAFPVRVNKLCRYIPENRAHLTSWFIVLVPGIIPLAVVGFELRLIFNSLWNGMVYYMIGFLGISTLLWWISVGLVTVLFVYQQLASEDWRWWWSAFFIPGGCGIHMFLFGTLYYATQLSYAHVTSTILYFTYLLMASMVYALVVGSIGFAACLAFVWTIYSAVRID